MFSLKKMFGKEVRVTKEESGSDEWCEQIVGRRGTIYPQSESTVCVETTHRIGQKLLDVFKNKAISRRYCSEGIDVIIPLDCVRTTFKYIKPKRRRQLTEEQKAVMIRRLGKFARPEGDSSKGVSSSNTGAGI